MSKHPHLDFEKAIIIAVLMSIILIGVIGNVLNLCVLGRKAMRTISTFRFLLYLSIIDLFVLLICSTDALLKYGFSIEVRLKSNVLCYLHTFLTYYLSHASSIVLMGVSIERLVSISKEVKRTHWKREQRISHSTLVSQRSNPVRDNFTIFFKSNRIEKIISLILIVLALINAHLLFKMKIKSFDMNMGNQTANDTLNETIRIHDFKKSEQERFLKETSLTNLNQSADQEDLKASVKSIEKLTSNENHSFEKFHIYICFGFDDDWYTYFLTDIWVWIDISTYSLIPFVVMTLCSFLIFIELKQQARKFQNNFAMQNKILVQKRLRRNRQIFIMLTATNAIFIACSLPYCILYFKANQGHNIDPKVSFLAHMLAYSNNSTNFIVYGFFSQKYRKEILKMFAKKLTNIYLRKNKQRLMKRKAINKKKPDPSTKTKEVIIN